MMLADGGANGGWLAQQRGGSGKEKAILGKIGDGNLKRARSAPESLKSSQMGNPYRHL